MLEGTRFQTAVTTIVVILTASLLAASPVGAQNGEVTCFGLTIADAEAQGYEVHLGTEGNDLFFGGNTTLDFMVGLGGDDVLTGAGAGDIICGGDGDDIINGGDGNDLVHGGDGADQITLGSGNDRGIGAGGDDVISGDAGVDIISGNNGKDEIDAGDGNDRVTGGAGADQIFGGAGNDLLGGNNGLDLLDGGAGRDVLLGGRNADILRGGDGRDRLIAGGGNDTLDGGAHRDRLRGGPGSDGCQPTGSDLLNTCETDLDGAELVEDVPDEEEPDNQQPPAGDPVAAADAPQGVNQFGWPLLTDAGLDAMLFCESTNNHAINTGNSFYGGVQWLPATWNAAADRAGYDQYVGVLPHLVPADVQDEVTKVWWSLTRPNTQWPHCHVKAMEAMNVLAP